MGHRINCESCANCIQSCIARKSRCSVLCMRSHLTAKVWNIYQCPCSIRVFISRRITPAANWKTWERDAKMVAENLFLSAGDVKPIEIARNSLTNGRAFLSHSWERLGGPSISIRNSSRFPSAGVIILDIAGNPVCQTFANFCRASANFHSSLPLGRARYPMTRWFSLPFEWCDWSYTCFMS